MAYESIYPQTAVGKIEVKTIPARTLLKAAGKGEPFKSRDESFGKLFRYIQSNKVSMTVPVEASATTSTMNFFVGGRDAGKELKSDGGVAVEKMEPRTVVSIGLRGSYTRDHYEQGLKKVGEWLEKHHEWQADGEPYGVYWNSPFVPGWFKRSEVHQPVRPAPGAPMSIYDFTMKEIDGREVKLGDYRGKVLLLVNVASRCGFTPQYAGLEKLYEKYRERGLVILGFPANNFLGQEPGSDPEIKAFCTTRYGVSFPMFSKISVKGADQHPLYQYLTGKATDPEFAGEISWNFNKFLAGRDGKIIGRFGSRTAPEDAELVKAVEGALGK